MKNSIGVLQTKISLPSINLTKVFIVINLWIFLFTNFFVLVPVTAYAATASKMSDVSYTQVFKSSEVYTTTVTVKGTGTVGISNVKSNLGRQVTAPKSIKLPGSFDMEIKCGDTVKLTVDGVEKEIKSPACTKETSTCENPVGWIEDATKGENYTTYYFAKDKKTILATDTLQNNPDKFTGLVCLGTSKQNYEVNGTFQKVDNKIIAIQKSPDKIGIGAETPSRFEYQSTGNDYQAYFAKNAKDGFKFTTNPDKIGTGAETPGSTIEVVKVTVGGKELQTPKPASISGDSITYYSVLPDIDLVYKLDNTGITKQLVLRNQNALKNNLSRIEFELSGAELKKETKAKDTIDKKLSDQKVDKKATTTAEIKKQKKIVDSLLPVVNSPSIIKVEDKTLNDLAGAKSTELDKLVKAIDNKEAVDVASELERIDNLPVADETVSIKSSTTKKPVNIDLPLSYSQNDSSLLKSESVTVSANGKTLTILPDVSSLKKLNKKAFPYIIDPRFYGYATPADDTYIGNDGTRVASRGYQRSMTVGARPEGGVAAVYLDGYNGSIGDAAAFIKFDVPGVVTTENIASAQLILRQYGSWNVPTQGFNAQIIKTSWFSEGSLTYYDNRPAEYGEYGNINFSNINTSCASCFQNAWSSDLSQIIREGNRQVYLKVMDRTATSKSATFCSKDGNIAGHPCNQSWNGPLLEIYLKGSPSAPVSQGMNYVDQVFGCTGQSCRNGTDIQYLTSGMNDGYADCVSSNIYQTTAESQGFQAWRNKNYNVGDYAPLFWTYTDKHVSEFGATCGSWFGYWERKLSGNYYHSHSIFNSDGLRSGWSGGTTYTVDTSAPVQIEANNTKLPTAIPVVKNNGNISFTIPKFVDDARSAVTITNAEGGVIDANGAILNYGLDTQIDTFVYGAAPKNVYQSWVIESNGQIRTLADGRCLTYKGGDLQMSTLRCQFNSSYTTNAAQGYEYLPETKQIRLINDRYWCIAKEGTALMLRQCTPANNQRWDITVVDAPAWASDTDKSVSENGVNIVNKSVQYKVKAINTKTGTVEKETEWNTTTNISISNLVNGSTYKFTMQARDRVVGTANYSDELVLGTTTIDNDAPVISNYTETTPVISPNNPTSVGVLDKVTFTYDYKDATPFSAWLDIYPSAGGSLVKRLGYDPTFDPNRNSPILTPNVNRTYYYTWDGKDTNGNFVADGTYKIKAYAIDQTCNVNGQDYNSQLCNKFEAFDANALSIKVDNTGANISVTTPTYNIWTNNKNYVITGGLGVYNRTGKEDKDVSELYINNVKSPFGTTIASNYSYTTNLNVGANTFTFSTKDQAGNVISNIGDPATGTIASWIVNYDNTIPKINSIIDNTPAGTIKSTKILKVSFSDTLSNVNLSNIAMDLYSSSDAKTFTKTQNLVNGGKIVNTNNVSALSCTTTECNVTLINLPDAYYKIFVNIADNATNTSCTFMQIPYTCNELSTFEKIIQVGTPAAGNIVGNDTDNTKSLLSVNMFPTYDGVNSADVLAQLQNGTRAIDQVQGLTVKVKVSQGTEAVDLYYSYDTNIAIKKIATLNNTIDSRPLYNGRNANVSKSQNNYLVDKGSTTLNKCDKVECEWTYTIVYDSSFAGGFPKLVVTSYKGINQDVATKTWEVNGQLKGNPRVLTFNKRNGSVLENANVYNNIFYTNTLTNRIEFAADASKTYTVTIRNTTNTSYTQNYTFVNDAFGSQYVEVNLPNADGNYDIVYNGIVVGKFVLDRVVPTLTSVQTTNLTPNSRAVMPFIRRGDSVKFDYTTSEPVWDSNLVLDGTQKVFAEKVTANCTTIPAYTLQYAQGSTVCNDAWRNSTTNTSTYQINNWQGGVEGVDGIVNPKIELVDYAGNKGSYLSTVQSTPVYSQTPRGVTTGSAIDFRLLADSISPDKSDFDTTSWFDGKDGVVADGVNPESDRLVAGRWVIRGNTITFKVKGERNARAVFTMNGSEQVANAVSTNCTAGTNTIVNGLVVKFGEMCDVSFSYNWTGTGAQNELGEALDYRNFQFYTIDLSGNTSAYSNSVMVWNDRTAAPQLTRTLQQNGVQVERFVNVNKVTDTSYGESKSDVEYQLYKNGVLQSTRVQRMGDATNTNGAKSGTVQYLDCSSGTCKAIAQIDNNKTSADFQIGNTTTDDVVGCVQTINGKRTGVCSDGIYEIKARQVDTAGNSSITNSKIVERDTVAPDIGTLAINKVGNTLGVAISGEAGATAVVTVSSSEGSKVREYPMDGTIQNIPNVLGYDMSCGGLSYGVQLKIRDAAGNVSAPVSKTTSTDNCRVCTSFDVIDKSTGLSIVIANSSIWLNPLRGQNYQSIPGSEYGAPRVWEGVTYPHEGLDLQAVLGTPVKATRAGIVIKSGSTGSKGNYVLIDHLDGYQSQYLHLSERSVTIGQVVDENTVIGKVGLTGNTDGYHLHFDIIKNGRNDNPALYLNKSSIKENAVIISENKDYKLVRYGGDGNCNVPLSLPPEKGTPTTAGTGGATTTDGVDSDDYFVSNIDDIINHRVNYELDPSNYLENNYNELVDVLKIQMSKYTNAYLQISKTLNCLAGLDPIGANPITFVALIKDCFARANIDWTATIIIMNDSLGDFGAGFGEGYWSGVKNIWEGPMGIFAAGQPSAGEIVTVVQTIGILWGIAQGGQECITSIFTNCSRLGDSMNLAKDFLWKMVTNQWDQIKAVWTGIIGLPKLVMGIIDGVKNFSDMVEGQTKKLDSMILFTILGVFTGNSSFMKQDMFTTSMLMSGEILRSFKTQLTDSSLVKKTTHDIGFILGIVTELATEQAVIWGLDALSEGTATPVAVAAAESKLTSTLTTILKVLKVTAGLVLFDSAAIFSIVKNMYTLKTWNVFKAAGISLKQLYQFGRELVLEVQKIDGKMYILWEDLLKFLKFGDEKQVAGMINRDLAFSRSLISGLSRNTKALEDLKGTSSILLSNNIHSKWGDIRWSAKWNKNVLDGIHEWDLIDQGVVTYTKSTSKLKYSLPDGRVMDWMVLEGIVTKDTLLGEIPKINESTGLPGISGMFPRLMTTAEKDAIKLNVVNQLLDQLSNMGDGKIVFQSIEGSSDLGYLKFSNDLTNKYFTYIQDGHKIEFRVFFNKVTKEVKSIQPAKFTY